MVQIQQFNFSESLEGARSDGMLKSQIWKGPLFPIFGKIPWATHGQKQSEKIFLKGFSLSSQKIIKITFWTNRTKVMAVQSNTPWAMIQ